MPERAGRATTAVIPATLPRDWHLAISKNDAAAGQGLGPRTRICRVLALAPEHYQKFGMTAKFNRFPS